MIKKSEDQEQAQRIEGAKKIWLIASVYRNYEGEAERQTPIEVDTLLDRMVGRKAMGMHSLNTLKILLQEGQAYPAAVRVYVGLRKALTRLITEDMPQDRFFDVYDKFNKSTLHSLEATVQKDYAKAYEGYEAFVGNLSVPDPLAFRPNATLTCGAALEAAMQLLDSDQLEEFKSLLAQKTQVHGRKG